LADESLDITAEQSLEIESRRLEVIDADTYVCPGERVPISRAVHLSRLSAFYAACRDCEHRSDVGHMPSQLAARIERTARRAPRRSLLAPEGVRGVYLNEMTRRDAESYAAAFARILWRDVDRTARPRTDSGAARPVQRGPGVVVGHDARPSSPDLVSGVVRSLRHNGCQVIDVGQVSGPCCWFAVEHLRAAGGVYVNGAQHGPSWNGLDFLEKHAVPWSRSGGLDELERQRRQDSARPTRSGGSYRTFACEEPYAAALWKHFHALRPLKVCVACGVPRIGKRIEELFGRLPCILTPLRLPVAEERARVAEQVAARMQAAIRSEQRHFGVWIDDDGQTCQVFDETGERLGTADLALRMIECLREEAVQPRLVLDAPLHQALDGLSTADGLPVDVVEGGREAISRAMWKSEGSFGCEHTGRFWFQESFATCDALVTLGKLLQLLSLSDRPASALRTR
jgi:phosphomannomutase